jgi:hypothetical protein
MRSLSIAIAGLLFAVSGAVVADDSDRGAANLTLAACATPVDIDKPDACPYRGLGIAPVSQGGAVVADRGVVWFRVTLTPYLRRGHTFLFAYDGKLLPMVDSALDFSLASVSRGTHTIQAHVVDPDGNTLISSHTVEFDVHERK